MEKKQVWAFLAFGLFNLFGGIMGYVKAGSLVSIVMGMTIGSAICISAYFAYKGSRRAYSTALVFVGITTVLFLYRFIQTFSIIPAGLMVILGITTLLCQILHPQIER